MVKLIQKSGYIKAGGTSGYMKYIATRERVEKLEGSSPVTKGQRQLIENLLQDFPDTAELEEYNDYRSAPTTGSASSLISAVLDANAYKFTDRDGYMRYIATRPRVERHGEHGLFSNQPVSLDAAFKEVETHSGNVWTFIWSLRREDAVRLGYDCAESWRSFRKWRSAMRSGTVCVMSWRTTTRMRLASGCRSHSKKSFAQSRIW